MENLNFKDLKSVSHKGVSKLSYEITQILENDPNRSPLYALMFVISKGNNTLESIYTYFKNFYVNEFSYIKLQQSDLDELLLKGINKSLIQKKEKGYYLTEKGKEILDKARKVVLVTNKAIKFFFSEKIVLMFSFVCLIFMSSLKIFVGLNNGSDALFNEGIENFTDIIKIIIISFSIKFNKDKLGAIIIILLMLITGINLVIASIFSLLETNVITPNYFSFILMFISIVINLMLLFLKNFVGKLNGNFSLLSDAKDNSNNIRLSLGVTIGLIFALFGIYFVDSIIGILIASLIIYDGIDTLTELIRSGEYLNIESFKLRLDEAFEFKIAHWILVTIQEESLSEKQLNNKFIEAIEKGYSIFGVWAIFGLYDFKKFGIQKILNLMIKRDLINEENNVLALTEKGKSQFDKAILKEIERVIKERKKYKDWKPPTKINKLAWAVFGILIFVGLLLIIIYVGPILYDFIVNLIK